MKNTMDSILVRYGSYDSEPCTLPDFLKRTDLSLTEQQGQKALAELYNLNQKEGLFERGFMAQDGTSLLLDFMPIYMDGACGMYYPQEHRINLGDERKFSVSRLTLVLAHELKHAEQCGGDIFANPDLNAFQKHQLGFLQEAQAYAFEQRVAYLCRKDLSTLYSQTKLNALVFGDEIDEKKLEQEVMCRLLPKLYNSSYKDDYDNDAPILDTDKGLEQFPDYLNVGPKVAKVISLTPRKAKSIQNQIKQEVENGRPDKISDLLLAKDIQGNIFMTPEKIGDLCFDLLRSGKKSDREFLKNMLTIQDKNGNFMIASQVMECVLSKPNFMLSLPDMVDLFHAKSKTGQPRISLESFNELSDQIRNKKNPIISICSKTSPQRYQKTLDTLDTIQKIYTKQPQNTTLQALKKTAGRD